MLDATVAATSLPRPQAQSLLGRFLFSGWETHERAVTALSGGERRRLSLALLVASGANLLVLDEPTNHLDLESREALEAALEAFPGTVLIVSHDRALLDAVPDRIVAVEDHALRSYDGGWADLQAATAAKSEQPTATEPAKTERSESLSGVSEAEAARSLGARHARSADRRDRGPRGGARGPARGRLVEHGPPDRAPGRPRRAAGSPLALGGALRREKRVTRRARGGV